MSLEPCTTTMSQQWSLTSDGLVKNGADRYALSITNCVLIFTVCIQCETEYCVCFSVVRVAKLLHVSTLILCHTWSCEKDLSIDHVYVFFCIMALSIVSAVCRNITPATRCLVRSFPILSLDFPQLQDIYGLLFAFCLCTLYIIVLTMPLACKVYHDRTTG